MIGKSDKNSQLNGFRIPKGLLKDRLSRIIIVMKKKCCNFGSLSSEVKRSY
jgi:hypothetical protein